MAQLKIVPRHLLNSCQDSFPPSGGLGIDITNESESSLGSSLVQVLVVARHAQIVLREAPQGEPRGLTSAELRRCVQ